MNKKILITLIIVIILGIGISTLKIVKKDNIPLTNEDCFEISDKGEITSYNEICGTEVNIPKKIKGIEVKEISKYVFSKKGLTKLILPETLKVIGIGAFEENEIEELVIPEGVENIKPYAFYSNKIEKLTIAKSVTNIGINAFNDNQMKKDEFIYMRNKDGVSTDIIIGYAGAERENVVIPEGTNVIYLSALANCDIKSIIFNNELTRIDSNSLENNNLIEITIPENVIAIGSNALNGNDNLSKIIIKGKENLEQISFDTTDLENVNIIFKK